MDFCQMHWFHNTCVSPTIVAQLHNSDSNFQNKKYRSLFFFQLTHAVLVKELKHVKHHEDLEVNENVKAKAKDFVKKYMGQYGAVYVKKDKGDKYDWSQFLRQFVTPKTSD